MTTTTPNTHASTPADEPLALGSSAGLGPTPPDDEHPYTYASTQATNCAGCGEYKHTPLRIDAMGGYVCLTCIDRKLGTLLGEFGYPAPQQPLTDDDALKLWRASDFRGSGGQADWFAEGIRAAERAHGIGA